MQADRKYKIYVILFISLFMTSKSGFSQIIATINVEAGKHNRLNTPVSLNISSISNLPDSLFLLEEIKGNQRTQVAYQMEDGRERTIWWILAGESKAGSVRKYQLVKGQSSKPAIIVHAKKADGALVISVADKNVLQYNYKTTYPPEGVNPFYKRSGFIHPLWSPQGAVLTNIQPKDHYHHYGIWNPWTKTSFEGDEIDFWNIAQRKGTVRFSDFINVVEGPVYGGFKALQNHVVYPDSAAEKTAMKEVWDVRVFNLPANAYLWEFTSTLNMATESPIVLEEYRYGGFGMRATDVWTNKNSKALTSEGKTRKDADGSKGRWAWINGDTDKGVAGVLFMSYPSNYNYPEPIRMWPEDANGGRGDVFFNFSPTKNKNWNLYPGKDYSLKYRLLVFEGEISTEKAEATWADFAVPPKVSIVKN